MPSLYSFISNKFGWNERQVPASKCPYTKVIDIALLKSSRAPTHLEGAISLASLYSLWAESSEDVLQFPQLQFQM